MKRAKRHILFAFVCLLLTILRAAFPTLLIKTPWDLGILLDGSWRVFQGQVPHIDFSTPIGPVTFLLGAAGMLVRGPSVSSLDFGFALTFLVVASMTYLAIYRFTKPLVAMSIALLVGSYVLTPRVLNWPFFSLGFIGIYNSVGVSIFFLLCLVLFLPFWRPISVCNERIGFLCGICIATLFFLKITFAVAAAIIYCVGLVARMHRLRFHFGVAVGVAFAAIAYLSYLRFDVLAIGRDLSFTAEARRNDVYSIETHLGVLKESYLGLLVMFLASVALYKKTSDSRVFLIAASFAVAGHVLYLSISQPVESFCVVIFVSIVLLRSDGRISHVKEGFVADAKIFGGNYSIVYLVMVIPIALAVANNALGFVGNIALQIVESQWPRYSDNAVINIIRESQPIARIENYRGNKEAISFIQNNSIPSERIMVVSTNMLSALLSHPSPHGVPLYWHEDVTYTLNALHHGYFRPESLFAEVDLILIPREYDHPNTVFEQFFGAYLKKHYRAAYRSPAWLILRKQD